MKNIYFFLLTGFLFLTGCRGRENPVNLQIAQFQNAKNNAVLANEGFIRCRNFTNAWLRHADPFSGLIPRNLQKDKDFWNARDAAADNYPFMVLTSFFVDREMFGGSMLDVLHTEERLTSRVGALPDDYSFSKKGFLHDDIRMPQIVFGSSEYVKDGLLPLTEWLGKSPWSERMLAILRDLHKHVDVAGRVGKDTYKNATREEVNGELLQTLSRVYWMTGDEALLQWAMDIGDFYLLSDHHPTKDLEYLKLRDHGCELVSGLCELYVSTHFAKPEKSRQYQKPLYAMLDRILETGRNEDGMFYNAINPITGEVADDGIADTWGYTLNGYYAVFMIDSVERYRQAVLKVFSNIDKYRNFDWEHGSSDGYADAIESALNLYNRIRDDRVAAWIDSEIKVMWGMQKDDGIIEGWHGDGNFARTTIMYNLWKSKGLYVQPWREDLKLGAEQRGDTLLISLSANSPWQGKLFFDKIRHKVNMHLPIDWPRINQFPEWFTVEKSSKYKMTDVMTMKNFILDGKTLLRGTVIHLEDDGKWMVFLSD